MGSLGASLLVGFVVGVAAAGALTSYSSRVDAPRAAASAARGSAETLDPSELGQARPTALTATRVAASCPAASSVAAKPPAPPAPSPKLERRWLLDRARSQQHQYRLSDAERLYRQVLASAPRDSEALSGLGELELLRGTLDLADARFQQALAVNADYLPALVAVADIRWQAGHIDEARQAYQDIVSRYTADLYPPYVALRGAAVVAPECDAER
jgi:tetratricopeptide (TPR) repeat protein